ncbi:hypothetical protein BDW74DRAFT_176659 [Aspergillus multicolor]|uniref:uncharacterized protein n=1 Tax=Aspergillus multicolor TaxID=41759 RepID=UPI003CCDBA59
MFPNPELPINAMFIEYIPNLHEIDLSTFSEHRAAKLRRILDEIYNAGIIHCDTMPRNMMVSLPSGLGEQEQEQEQGSARARGVVCIDFGLAQELPPPAARTPTEERWLRHEIRLVEYFINELAKDYE